MLDTNRFSTPAQPTYLDVAQIAARLVVSTDTIWRWKREGRFPKARKLSARLTRWLLADIEAWEAERTMCFATDLCLEITH
ncbi:AlpA family phage regulatory protein [Pararhodobacter sp. SW119]|uniref:helix-turn-helix transcriptional regulator n=1 Tax=Pararhodobacter sp. SW119 TaxID=2780075 RepID=UPI001AE0C92E